MVIDSMFVYHFADPDLRVEIIFRKEGANSYKLLQTVRAEKADEKDGVIYLVSMFLS